MLVVFDCDGTLVDSQANIVNAMADAFVRHRLEPPTAQQTRRIVGLSLIEAVQALLPDADSRLQMRVAEDYKQGFHRLRASGALAHEPLFDGVRELLEALHDRGFTLGVATGKSDRGLELCLTEHKLIHLFTTLQTADRHPSKPHPSMIAQCLADSGKHKQETWMIGDTAFDMQMAVNAGVHGLGVNWGYHDEAELLAAGARATVNDCKQILHQIESAQHGQ